VAQQRPCRGRRRLGRRHGEQADSDQDPDNSPFGHAVHHPGKPGEAHWLRVTERTGSSPRSSLRRAYMRRSEAVTISSTNLTLPSPSDASRSGADTATPTVTQGPGGHRSRSRLISASSSSSEGGSP